MAISPIVPVRLKEVEIEKLDYIQKFAGFKTRSDTVRQLIQTGISFWTTRKKEISEIKDKIGIFTIKPEELYEGLRYKRDYLSFVNWGKHGLS